MAVIEVSGLSYSYPTSSIPALKNLDFQVEAGQFVAVIGANGAGKSTLCLALSGLIPALFNGKISGSVSINGMNTSDYSPAEFAGKVGLVLQNPANQLSEMRYTVFEELAFGLENLGISALEMPARIERTLEQTGLKDLRNRSPYSLSGGEQQRLALAAMLVLEPPVLILDEPTAMLDPQSSWEVFKIILSLTQTGTTVIISEHHLEWIAEYADRVIVLDGGEIVLDGKPAEVLTSPALQEAGIGSLRYTQAAILGKIRGLWPETLPLPVTMQQAAAGFTRTSSPKPLEEINHANPD